MWLFVGLLLYLFAHRSSSGVRFLLLNRSTCYFDRLISVSLKTALLLCFYSNISSMFLFVCCFVHFDLSLRSITITPKQKSYVCVCASLTVSESTSPDIQFCISFFLDGFGKKHLFFLVLKTKRAHWFSSFFHWFVYLFDFVVGNTLTHPTTKHDKTFFSFSVCLLFVDVVVEWI